MAHFKDLFARHLRAYPMLYPEPVDLIVEMLGDSGNFEWRGGELCETHEIPEDRGNGERMDYSDLDEEQARLDGETDAYMEDLNAWHGLEIQAQRMKREFMDINMAVIVAANPTESLFRNDFEHSRIIRELISGKKVNGMDARYLYFPDDITPEWSEKLVQFHDWLLVRLNNEYMATTTGSIDHWPEEAQLLKDKIEVAQNRLHPLIHNGQTRQEYIQYRHALVSELVAENKQEERGAQNADSEANMPNRPGP